MNTHKNFVIVKVFLGLLAGSDTLFRLLMTLARFADPVKKLMLLVLFARISV